MERYYDTIVVGAGSAGATLAARLTERSDRSLLLLEAGRAFDRVDDFPLDVLDGRSYRALVPGNPSNWSLHGRLTPDVSAPISRGKIVGGSSAINGLIFLRGDKRDFDRWVDLGNAEWGWTDVEPCFRRLEADREFGSRPGHGSDGPIPVTRSPYSPEHITTRCFSAACAELGFSFCEDLNAVGSTGYGRLPLSVAEGIRVNTAMAYLISGLGRSNLTLRGQSEVSRVVFDGTRAVGVDVRTPSGVERVHGSEIILSAGALKTPQLLMLSGVGAADQLSRFGIPVVSNLPGVGQGMADHPEIFLHYEANAPKPAPGGPLVEAALLTRSSLSRDADDLEIIPSVAPLLYRMRHAAARRPPRWAEVRQLADSVRKTSPRLLWDQARARDQYVLCVSIMQQDEYRGSVELRSADPADPPVLNYRYMESESDLARAREGVKLGVDILDSPHFRAFVSRRTSLADENLSDARALDRWLRRSVATAFHSCRTARMGPADDPAAVVNGRGEVYGTEGLRVADLSILPWPVTRGTAPTAIMLAERLADLIEPS